MFRCTFGKYIYVAIVFGLTIIVFDILTTPYVAALILLWFFSLYAVISPIVKWSRFKSFLNDKHELYIPSPNNKPFKRNFFNLKIHSDTKTVDVFEENKLKTTFYTSQGKIQTKKISNNVFQYSQTKALLSRISERGSYSLLDYRDNGSGSVMRMYSGRFYVLTESNKIKYLFTAYCRFDEHRARDVERTMHSREDFFQLLESFSKQLSDLTGLPMVVYKEK